MSVSGEETVNKRGGFNGRVCMGCLRIADHRGYSKIEVLEGMLSEMGD